MTDLQAYAKYNDNQRYIISVIDVFSKFLHKVPVKTKSGPSVASAFRSTFNDQKYSTRKRRPIWVRTEKGKKFLIKHFQDMLQGESLDFQVCKNPDLKCAVVERAHHTIRDKIYKYFTYKYIYRYINVLPKFVRAYIDTVHSTTDIAPSRVTDSDFHVIWKRMEGQR